MAEGRQKTRILIADQQPIFRQGIRSSLNQIGDIDICGEVGTGDELMSAINNLFPDVILLDINLSSGDGSDLAKAVKQQLPSVAVILLSPKPNDDELFQAIKSRVAGYLKRDVSSEELVTTIRRAASGEHPINDTLFAQPKVAAQVLQQFQDFSWGKGVESFVSPLTPRETEILSYMAKGYLNKQIADTLFISEQTIKNHITSILRKLDANART
ncbi:MAG: response regulator transcription factor, partial [Chloroflexi bacterium]|nr:response regulator transcription factor [Chloroflexota bacterium]